MQRFVVTPVPQLCEVSFCFGKEEKEPESPESVGFSD